MEEFDIRNIQRRHQQQGDAGPAQAGGGGGGGGGRALPALPRCDPKVGGGMCCCGLVLLAILLLSGLASLSPLQYGLKYNRFTKVTDDKHVQFRGRHFIWPWCSFLRFPAVTKNLELSDRAQFATAKAITGRTAEGLALEIHVAFQYKLHKDSLSKLYKKVGFKYEAYFMKLARENIIASASRYTAPQYWGERDKLGDEMFDLVKIGLDANYAECSGLQILRIELPDNYEQAIVRTQVTRQQAYTQENAQMATWVRANISVMNATYKNNITVIMANASAESTRLIKFAEAEANKAKLDAEKKALDVVQGNLSLSSSAMVDYQRMFAYTQIPDAKFLFGINSAVIIDTAS